MGRSAGSTPAPRRRCSSAPRSCASSAAPGAAGLDGELVRSVGMGFVTHVTVRLASGDELLAYRLNDAAGRDSTAGREALRAGQRVRVAWDEDDARVFPAESEAGSEGARQRGREGS